jgi:predicted ATPase
VLFICEDLHWIDPSSRELLDGTIDRAAGLSVLIVATRRIRPALERGAAGYDNHLGAV